MKRFFLLLTVLFLLLVSSLSVAAKGRVTFLSDSDRFIFDPGSPHSPTDLFSSYKNLMPGDSVSQEITVKNGASYETKVKLYVRSFGAEEGSEAFLSKLHLTVAKVEQNEMAYMFDAAADQGAVMADWVYLGTLYSGGEVNLVLNLAIPLELGNEYQNAAGTIRWEFKVEKLPVEPSDPLPPQTGDRSRIGASFAIAFVSGAARILLVYRYRKKKDSL